MNYKQSTKMSDQEVTVVAILTPQPGKIDEVGSKSSKVVIGNVDLWANQLLQVIEGLAPLLEHVKANEPDVLRYELFKQTNGVDGAENLVYIEV